MQLTVNGDALEAPSDLTVTGLLRRLGLEGRPCAVEINRELAPKKQHETRTLSEGDTIEIVTLVGGG